MEPHLSGEELRENRDKLMRGITLKTAKRILNEMFLTGKSAEQLIEEQQAWQITDPGELASKIKQTINDYPKALGDYRQGKKQALNFILGKMDERINPDLAREVINYLLK